MKAIEKFEKANLALNIAGANNIIAKRVLSDLDTINSLKSNKDEVIDLSNAYNTISTVAKLGYVAGSKIGQIISVTCVCEALKDPELNKQFLAKESEDVVDLHKLSLVFPFIGTVPSTEEGYVSVFGPELHANVTDKLGREQIILLAGKAKIEDFSNRIKTCTMLHKNDLVTIGRDLEIVATVMSELEIDAAKDEKKREGMIDLSEFMNEYMVQNSRSIAVINNFNQIKEEKKNNSTSKTELSQSIVTGRSLFQYEEILEELKAEREAQLNEGVEPEFKECELPGAALGRCSVMDPLYALVESMVEVTNNQMSRLGELYRCSNMDMFKGFDIMPERNEEANKYQNETITQSVIAIKKAAVLTYNMINSVYKYKKHMSMCRVEDLAVMGRNIIYTMAQDRGIDLMDAFYLAVDAAWLKIDSKGALSPRGSFAYKACEAMFSNELKCHFNAEAMSTEVDIEIPEELFELEDLFVDGRIFNFEDGSCEIQGEDGEYYSMIRIDNDEFNGKVVVKIDEEGYLTFLEALNPFGFERVDFFMLDSIANMGVDANKLNAEELAALIEKDATDRFAFHNVYNKSKIVDTNKAYAPEAELLKFANKVEPVIKQFAGTVKFTVSHSDIFSLYPNRGRNHLYMKDTRDGAARMIGSLAQFSISKSLPECSNMKVLATPVGAMIVVK